MPAVVTSTTASLKPSPSQEIANLDSDSLRALLDRTNVFIFDCDGVLWQGSAPIAGVPETLAFLRSLGKRIFFVSNNSTKSRSKYLEKFARLGITASRDEVLSSAFAAALLLRDHPALELSNTEEKEEGEEEEEEERGKEAEEQEVAKKKRNNKKGKKKKKKVYVVGEQGIIDELAAVGIESVGGPAHADRRVTMEAGEEPRVDPDIGAVCVGFDRNLNYYKIQYAQRCVRHLGAEFVATNRDPISPLTKGHEWAGGGSMVGALVGCLEREPIVAGKPSSVLIDYILAMGHSPEECLMVGDRLNTDILFGVQNSLQTLLVLSGVTKREHLQDLRKLPAVPDFVCETIAGLMK
eukprot:UC1_evm1s114